MLELPSDLENQLREQAALRGLKVADYLWHIVSSSSELSANAERPRGSDPAYLMSLLKAETE